MKLARLPYRFALFLAVAFNVSLAAAQTFPPDGGAVDAEQVSVEVLNLRNMPLKIEAVETARYGERFAVKYSVTNSTDKSVSSFKGVFFTFGVSGELLDVEDFQLREEVAAHATRRWAYLLQRAAHAGERVVVALLEVTGEDGIWRVDRSKLEASVKARLSGQTDELPRASHEGNVTLSDDDRREIIRTALEEAIIKRHMPNLGYWDRQRADKTKEKLDIYLMKENVAADLLPELSGVNLILLDADEMKARADSEGSLVYLLFSKFKAEGPAVIVALDIHLLQGGSPDARKFWGWGAGNTYEYRRENGKWLGRLISSWIV